MQPILELNHISKKFPGVQALDDVHFDILPGEVHAIVGENGAGKSTLIKIISGVYTADEGMMHLEGQGEVQFNSPREAQQAGIATIYQELSLYRDLSVAENIFTGHLPRRRFGAVDWPMMRQQAREILHSLEIYDLDVNRKVGMLSVGNQQRVEIAKALSRNARILIMDEPTAALTESDVEQLFKIVRLLQERNVAIIYISHRLQEIFTLANRVTVLRDGQYIGTKQVAETTEGELISMMVGRTVDNLFPKLETEIGAPVLEVRNLWRKPFTLGVDLTVHAGEIVGLAGLIGSGRSELAQVIFGISPAKSGQVLIDGKRVKINHPGDAMRLGIAYVPEERGSQGLIRQMTVQENLTLAVLRSLTQGPFVDRNAEKTLAQQMIEQLRIRAYSREQIVNKLSGGNQQKVVVGKWLASRPRILIMDEPTRGIDVGAKAEIHRLMSELAMQGMAVLMISSEMPEILGMSDRIVVMREGKVAAEFSRAEATQEKVATAMMSEQNGSGDATVIPSQDPTPVSGGMSQQ
jgi:ABC-type sugar transport system ATPase subunit